MRLAAPIECRSLAPPGGLTLVGCAGGGERVYLTLRTAVPPDLPERIESGSVERLDGARYRIASGDREWIVTASRSFAHRDVAESFYAALPPRRVPLAKRLFWRLVLAAAASRPGRRWLMRER